MLDREQFGSKHQTVLLKREERLKMMKWIKTFTFVTLLITIEFIRMTNSFISLFFSFGNKQIHSVAGNEI